MCGDYYVLPPYGKDIYINYLEFFCMGILFYTLSYNIITLYFVHVVPALDIEHSFSWLLFPILTQSLQYELLFLLFSEHVLTSGTIIQGAPGSSCIVPASVLESAISPRRLDSFYWSPRSGLQGCSLEVSPLGPLS